MHKRYVPTSSKASTRLVDMSLLRLGWSSMIQALSLPGGVGGGACCRLEVGIEFCRGHGRAHLKHSTSNKRQRKACRRKNEQMMTGKTMHLRSCLRAQIVKVEYLFLPAARPWAGRKASQHRFGEGELSNPDSLCIEVRRRVVNTSDDEGTNG